MSEKQKNLDAVHGVASDLMRARPEEIRALTNGKSDRLTSEQAHRLAAEKARETDRKKEGGR